VKPLVIIPARGSSKGVPGKNIKLLKDKPLIYYTIEAAREVFSDDVICVSTDDVVIKECVEKTGLLVPFLRPKELATDVSGTYEVLLNALNYYEANKYFPDTIILLQPTSPFRNSKHIKAALKLFDSNNDMLVSVHETKANPYFLLFEEDEHGFLKKSKDGDFTRRQDCPKVWEYNGAIYIINVRSLRKQNLNAFNRIKKYEMDSFSSHDIDTFYDWKLAELMIEDIKMLNEE
jgi:CMP-N,N'-diacetyllegionaminic acid synthase